MSGYTNLPHRLTHHKLTYHRFANLFPLMEGEEFDALVADIKENGQRDLATVINWRKEGRGKKAIYLGEILDGRNRDRACQKIDDEDLRFEVYWLQDEKHKVPVGGAVMSDEKALNFVISKNVRRRHLTAGQRALIAIEIEKVYAEAAAKRQKAGVKVSESEKGTSLGKAAAEVGVSERTAATVKRVVEAAPDLTAKLQQGSMSANAAEDEVRVRRLAAQAEVKKARDENPREVVEYLGALKTFDAAIGTFLAAVRTASRAIDCGKLSPGARRLIQQGHWKIESRRFQQLTHSMMSIRLSVEDEAKAGA